MKRKIILVLLIMILSGCNQKQSQVLDVIQTSTIELSYNDIVPQEQHNSQHHISTSTRWGLVPLLQSSTFSANSTTYSIDFDSGVSEFTLEEDSLLHFDSDNRFRILIYGKDNRNIYIWDIGVEYPFFLPKGTYYLQLPNDVINQDDSYNFMIETEPFIPEQDIIQTFDNVIVDGEVTIYQYYLQFDYAGDVETISIDLELDTYVSYTYFRYLETTAKLIVDGEIVPYDVTDYYREPNRNHDRTNPVLINEYDGYLEISFVSDQINNDTEYLDQTIDMIYGEALIEIYVIPTPWSSNE